MNAGGRLRRNLLVNALSQASAFVLSLAVFPVYLGMLGNESYALIGFALTVQIWVNLLDLGFSPIFARDTARMNAGAVPEQDVLSFLRSIDWLLAAITIGALSAALAGLGFWAKAWFEPGDLDPRIIDQSMSLVILFSAVRLASAFYRSGLLGFDRQILVSVVTIFTNIGRLALPIAALLLLRDVRIIFVVWVIVSIIEVVILRRALSRSFTLRHQQVWPSLRPLRSRISLTGQIALSALLWTTVTQVDKLILSRTLPLGEYGYFSLAVVLAGGLAMVPIPVITAFQPRLTANAAIEAHDSVASLISLATRILTVTTLCPALVLAAIPETAIYAWTGNRAAAVTVAPYLGAYLVATALLGFGGLLYALQVAYGRVTLPLVANLLFAATIIPTMIVVADGWGAWGAAHLWLALTGILAATYYLLVLIRFLRGEIAAWYLRAIAAPAMAAVVVGLLTYWLAPTAPGRFVAIGVTLAALSSGILASAVLAGLTRPGGVFPSPHYGPPGQTRVAEESGSEG